MINISRIINDIVDLRGNSWIEFRHNVHSFPEIGWTEFVTTFHIIDFLKNIGLSPEFGERIHVSDKRLGIPKDDEIERCFNESIQKIGDVKILEPMRGGFTGAVVVIQGKYPGKTKALRVDIDALPITELQNESHIPYIKGFSSCRRGVMHACGHDAHVAIAIGVAEIIYKLREYLHGKIKIIFQPAEEGVRGAISMLETGIANDIDELYGVHVGVNALESGQLVGGWSGLLATTKIDITFNGRSAHAAINPEYGRDAVAAACEFVTRLKYVKRDLKQCIIHVGRVCGGIGKNIVADKAHLEMETRAKTNQENQNAKIAVMDLLNEVSDIYNVSYCLSVVGEALSANSDNIAANKVIFAASKVRFFDNVTQIKENFGASDDISMWMNKVQENGGIASFIGIGTGVGTGHHSPGFDIDDNVIPNSIKLISNIFMSD